MQSTASTLSVNEFDIEDFVREATWKDILVELVKKEELNPWDIDIVDLVEHYIEAVKRLKVLDLRIPANIILAAAILLRLKSDMLEIEEQTEEMQAMDDIPAPYVAVDALSMRLRLPPKRRIALNELIGALEEAMKLKEYKEAQAAVPEFRPTPMIFNHADVEVDVENVYSLVKKNIDGSKMVTYSALCDVAKSENSLLQVFIPLLFLANKNRVLMLQESFFGEILVSLN